MVLYLVIVSIFLISDTNDAVSIIIGAAVVKYLLSRKLKALSSIFV